ncbi:MAG: DUF1993 domain-containing protein [Hyphomonadaceae bacterium]
MSASHSVILKSTSAQMLASLGYVLKKGGEHATALKAPEEVFLNFRLYPDMFPLSRQVQICADNAARGAARLAGVQLPSFPDTETTFAQLIERTQKALAYVQGVSSEAIDARADAEITFPIGGGNEMTMPAQAFLLNYVLPNVFFHAATAYDILRHNGVPLGKRDFLRPGG